MSFTEALARHRIGLRDAINNFQPTDSEISLSKKTTHLLQEITPYLSAQLAHCKIMDDEIALYETEPFERALRRTTAQFNHVDLDELVPSEADFVVPFKGIPKYYERSVTQDKVVFFESSHHTNDEMLYKEMKFAERKLSSDEVAHHNAADKARLPLAELHFVVLHAMGEEGRPLLLNEMSGITTTSLVKVNAKGNRELQEEAYYDIMAKYCNTMEASKADTILDSITSKLKLERRLPSLNDLHTLVDGTHPYCKMERCKMEKQVNDYLNLFTATTVEGVASLDEGGGQELKRLLHTMRTEMNMGNLPRYVNFAKEMTGSSATIAEHLQRCVEADVDLSFDDMWIQYVKPAAHGLPVVVLPTWEQAANKKRERSNEYDKSDRQSREGGAHKKARNRGHRKKEKKTDSESTQYATDSTPRVEWNELVPTDNEPNLKKLFATMKFNRHYLWSSASRPSDKFRKERLGKEMGIKPENLDGDSAYIEAVKMIRDARAKVKKGSSNKAQTHVINGYECLNHYKSPHVVLLGTGASRHFAGADANWINTVATTQPITHTHQGGTSQCYEVGTIQLGVVIDDTPDGIEVRKPILLDNVVKTDLFSGILVNPFWETPDFEFIGYWKHTIVRTTVQGKSYAFHQFPHPGVPGFTMVDFSQYTRCDPIPFDPELAATFAKNGSFEAGTGSLSNSDVIIMGISISTSEVAKSHVHVGMGELPL